MNKTPSSDEDDASFCTPPELAKAAEDLRGDLLPAKSREKYKAIVMMCFTGLSPVVASSGRFSRARVGFEKFDN